MYLNHVVFYLTALIGFSCSTVDFDYGGEFDFDYLVFSQRWPITSCIDWKTKSAKEKHTCNLPPYLDVWNIHGVWPTRNDSDGPYSCPSAMHWDPNALKPILEELNVYWVNIEEGTKPNSFWAHEWNKHGTCASALPVMNTVEKYFQKSINLLNEFNMTDILYKGGVTPNDKGYTLQEIYDAIKLSINKEPAIMCIVDQASKNTLLSEIHVCLDKSFNLIDCISNDNSNIISDCGTKKTIMYFDVLPPSFEMDYMDNSMDSFQKYIENQQYFMMLYKLFKMLIYVTL